MSTKPTLRMESALIERAKHYARARGKSVSRLVADFALLQTTPAAPATVESAERLPPITRSLFGCLDGADYRRHLEEKYS